MKSGLTHTATHTAKCPKSGGEDMYLILSAALLFLHDLCHEIAHLFGGALLHLPRDVGVGAECESRVEMTEHTVFAECTSHYIKASTLERAVLEAAHCGFAGNGRIRLRCIKGSAPWGLQQAASRALCGARHERSRHHLLGEESGGRGNRRLLRRAQLPGLADREWNRPRDQ